MIYSQPPFASLSLYHKTKAIPDSKFVIEFPEVAVPYPKNEKTGVPGTGVAIKKTYWRICGFVCRGT
jgi:hypothetical protein